MTSPAEGENGFIGNEASEAASASALDVSWQWLDIARLSHDPKALDNCQNWLEGIMTEQNPQTPEEYELYFNALNTYAFMPVWEAMVNNRHATKEDVNATRARLCTVLDHYPLNPHGDRPAYHSAVVETILITMLTNSHVGMPLPDAPYRGGIGAFNFDLLNGKYYRICMEGRGVRSALSLKPDRLVNDAYSQTYLRPPQDLQSSIMDAPTTRVRATILFEEFRNALLMQADLQDPPRHIQTTMQITHDNLMAILKRVTHPRPWSQ